MEDPTVQEDSVRRHSCLAVAAYERGRVSGDRDVTLVGKAERDQAAPGGKRGVRAYRREKGVEDEGVDLLAR